MNRIKKAYPLLPLAAALLPLITYAQTVKDIVRSIRDIVNMIIPILMAIAVAIFLWGIIKFILAGGDDTKEKTAKGYIIYGLIGIFVMVAFWGIIQIAARFLGVNPGDSPVFPTITIPGF